MLAKSFILALSAIHLITMVIAYLVGLTKTKVMLNSLIHSVPYVRPGAIAKWLASTPNLWTRVQSLVLPC